MEQNQTIEHEGIVREIRDGKVKVSFVAKSACAHCQLSGVCSTADMEEKEVEVQHFTPNIRVGEKVNVVLARSLGMKALVLGYIIPFFLVVIALFVSLEITNNELISGLISLSILIPWYLGLYLSRSKIRRQFDFSIQKLV